NRAISLSGSDSFARRSGAYRIRSGTLPGTTVRTTETVGAGVASGVAGGVATGELTGEGGGVGSAMGESSLRTSQSIHSTTPNAPITATTTITPAGVIRRRGFTFPAPVKPGRVPGFGSRPQ